MARVLPLWRPRPATGDIAALPLQQGAASKGAFGLLFWTASDGAVVGGDYTQEANPANGFAFTTDGGITWSAGTGNTPGGFRSAVVRSQRNGFAGLLAVWAPPVATCPWTMAEPGLRSTVPASTW